MAGRRIFNEQDARRCLAAAKAARGGPAEWARAHGIDGRSLNAWRMNLERRGRPQPARPTGALARAGLVELLPAPAPAPPLANRTVRYSVHVGGLRLDFGDDVDERTLRRVVAALRSC